MSGWHDAEVFGSATTAMSCRFQFCTRTLLHMLTAGYGASRKWRDARFESAMCHITDIGEPTQLMSYRQQSPA
jgi:hypothetical protein